MGSNCFTKAAFMTQGQHTKKKTQENNVKTKTNTENI